MNVEDLIGTWMLETFNGRSSAGAERRPFGDKPHGQLVYSADGYMSVVLSRDDRPRFAATDFAGGSAEEIRKAYAGFEAYAGRFELDAARGVVKHHLAVCRYPNWEGGTQVRQARIEGDRLHLATPPMPVRGDQWVYTLTWRRAPRVAQ
jgi:hypothetical protein